jgi:hypothetical protein
MGTMMYRAVEASRREHQPWNPPMAAREGELDAGVLLPDASCLGKESRTPNSSPTPPANSGGREECAAHTRAAREGAEREGEEGAHGCASSRGRVGISVWPGLEFLERAHRVAAEDRGSMEIEEEEVRRWA